MNKKILDTVIIGFALFAMFFGAGNLIFPPYLGMVAGDKFNIAAIAFTITGVGIPFLGILAGTKCDGSFEKMASKVGPLFATICATGLFIAIGPMLAIPRTAATTFELSFKPFFPGLTPIVGMIIYFSINLIFILRPSKIIDSIGKYLTPVLLISLLAIIIKGIVSPLGEISPTTLNSVFSHSLIEGYQTMDALGALIFASIIVSAVKSKGYSGQEGFKLTIKSGLVAIISLAIIYGGLMYLGAHLGNVVPKDIEKTALLLYIANATFGYFGTVLIGLSIGLACLTTSIGLISSGATFFEEISKGKLNYKFNAITISLISIFVGSLGVEKIVVLAVPVLCILYPVAITLILTTLLDKVIKNNIIIKYAVYTALTISIIDTLPKIGVNIPTLSNLLSSLPLSNLGFAWTVPTLIVFVLSFMILNKKANYELAN